VQRIPIDNNFPTADAKETAKIDNGRAYPSGLIDKHVDDVPHVLIGCAKNLSTENS